MRVLFLHQVFPGPFRYLASAYGAQKGNTVLFLAERGQRAALPGVRRLRIAPADDAPDANPAERGMTRLLRRAARAGNAMLALRGKGFAPDLVCAAAGTGGSLYLRDIFPRAFYVAYADWFHEPPHNRTRPAAEFAQARVRNLWQYNALGDCDLALTFSRWQRQQYPPLLRRNISVVPCGVDTMWFSPAPQGDVGVELVTFCGAPGEAGRGFSLFVSCLPRLLALRPRCHAVIAWPEGTHAPHAAGGVDGSLELLSPLGEAERRRVRLLGACQPETYRAILRQSTAHVYLSEPQMLSTGLLEALACGVLVVASDTPPVREVVRHGINGFLCAGGPDALAETLAEVLDRAPQLRPVCEAARESAAREYDASAQAARAMALIAGGMSGRDAGKGKT